MSTVYSKTREELLVFYRAPPLVADRGMLTRYGGYRGNKIPGGGPKLELLPCSLILAYQGLEEGNLDQKSPGPPGWGLMQQASPLLIKKKGKLLKCPLEILWIDTTYDDISYVRGLYD